MLLFNLGFNFSLMNLLGSLFSFTDISGLGKIVNGFLECFLLITFRWFTWGSWDWFRELELVNFFSFR